MLKFRVTGSVTIYVHNLEIECPDDLNDQQKINLIDKTLQEHIAQEAKKFTDSKLTIELVK